MLSKIEDSRKRNLLDKDKYTDTKQSKFFDVQPKTVSKQKVKMKYFLIKVNE